MNRIHEFRAARGWSLQKLADAAGTSKGQIDKLEKGMRRLTVDWMLRLARPLGCEPRDLLPLALETKSMKPTALPFGKNPGPTNMIPIRGSRRAAVDHVPRPYFLSHAKDAYAVYMPDDSMAPMYRARQLLFVNPYKPASAGNGVVIIGRKGEMRVRELVRIEGKSAVVREYQPKKRETVVSLRENIAIHAVAGTVEL